MHRFVRQIFFAGGGREGFPHRKYVVERGAGTNGQQVVPLSS